LIDGGGRYDDGYDTGARIVGPVLAAKGIRRVNLMVLSHPHPDHMNGLFFVLQRFQVDRFWTNGDGGGNPRWNDLMALARARKVKIELPYHLETAGLVLEPRGPWLDNRISAPRELEVNDASLVLQLSVRGRKILLTGDIGEQGELELLGRAGESNGLASEVLKVPHHGSRFSSGADFIAGVNPSMGVISVGRFNRFGLPSPVTLGRYDAAGIRLFRTDLVGAVSISIGNTGNLSATCVLPCR
jgi:competence protein ComEC